MLFVDLSFFLFFAIVLSVYWSLESNDRRKWFLLGASYFFYGAWNWKFVILLFGISIADYWLALQIGKTKKYKKLYVLLSISMNLTVLAIFKYFNFFVDNAIALAQLFQVELSEPTVRIILPVGISFFTFQSLSYTIDTYRGEIQPVQRARDYLLFAAFFPQLVAGPIVRPKYFLPQLQSTRTVSFAVVRSMLLLFLLGFIKKACIADNISPYVDRVFAAPANYDAASTTIATWLYATQIYCDFSGYSDMAIAVGGLMGYRLALNFNAPYTATSLQDFWRRWHISLSSWIRDYIYISLGGRSPELLLFYRNLMMTMLAGGLWHGPAWTFVLWGGLHGAGQVVQHEYKRIVPERFALPKLVGWFVTLQYVCICWILFRAANFDGAITLITQYLWLGRGGAATLPSWLIYVAPGLLLLQWLSCRCRLLEQLEKLEPSAFSFAYGGLWALSIAMLPLGFRPFIYFQF